MVLRPLLALLAGLTGVIRCKKSPPGSTLKVESPAVVKLLGDLVDTTEDQDVSLIDAHGVSSSTER